MIPKKLTFQDGIFVITQEKSCPMYIVGDEIKVSKNCISIGGHKPACLILSQSVVKITGAKKSIGRIPAITQKKETFDCGGCEGIAYFEYKKDKDFATVQMRMLMEFEEKRKRQHLNQFFNILRKMPLFEPLDDDVLNELTLLLEFKLIPPDKIILKKGEEAIGLCIVLDGKVAVLNEGGSLLTEVGGGELFGEISLLSGEPVTNSVHTIAQTHMAFLKTKNFKEVITKHPVLQVFLFKMLIERAQSIALRQGDITSGMTGKIDEISVVDLLQLIHSSQKTGTVELFIGNGRAEAFFVDGELIDVKYEQNDGLEAFCNILKAQSGHFSYTKGVPADFENMQPMGDFMALLMEGLQRIDEKT